MDGGGDHSHRVVGAGGVGHHPCHDLAPHQGPGGNDVTAPGGEEAHGLTLGGRGVLIC